MCGKTTAETRAKVFQIKCHHVTSAAVRSKVVGLLFLIHCYSLLPLFVGFFVCFVLVLVCSTYCPFSFVIIPLRMRELIALL